MMMMKNLCLRSTAGAEGKSHSRLRRCLEASYYINVTAASPPAPPQRVCGTHWVGGPRILTIPVSYVSHLMAFHVGRLGMFCLNIMHGSACIVSDQVVSLFALLLPSYELQF
jgi:hypothetical protein